MAKSRTFPCPKEASEKRRIRNTKTRKACCCSLCLPFASRLMLSVYFTGWNPSQHMRLLNNTPLQDTVFSPLPWGFPAKHWWGFRGSHLGEIHFQWKWSEPGGPPSKLGTWQTSKPIFPSWSAPAYRISFQNKQCIQEDAPAFLLSDSFVISVGLFKRFRAWCLYLER